MQLAIGRIVHYVAYGTPGGEYPKACRPALVTQSQEIDGESHGVSLAVFTPSGLFFNHGVPAHIGPELEGGTWHSWGTCPSGSGVEQPL